MGRAWARTQHIEATCVSSSPGNWSHKEALSLTEGSQKSHAVDGIVLL